MLSTTYLIPFLLVSFSFLNYDEVSFCFSTKENRNSASESAPPEPELTIPFSKKLLKYFWHDGNSAHSMKMILHRA